MLRKSKQVKPNKTVAKAIQYVSETTSLNWFDYLRFNVIKGTNETVNSLSLISMEDLFSLNEFVDQCNLIESVQNAVEQDEIEKANNKR